MLTCLFAALTSVGFALIYRARFRYLPWMALGGLLAYGSYLLAFRQIPQIFCAALISGAVTALYCEGIARLLRAPSLLFLMPSLISMVPGSYLYYAMHAMAQRRWADAWHFGGQTLYWALGLSAGVGLVTVIKVFLFRRYADKRDTGCAKQ